jgi:hypothetical protein
MKITIIYDGEQITVGVLGNIDITMFNGVPHLYFIDNGIGEEWEIPAYTVIKIER